MLIAFLQMILYNVSAGISVEILLTILSWIVCNINVFHVTNNFLPILSFNLVFFHIVDQKNKHSLSSKVSRVTIIIAASIGFVVIAGLIKIVRTNKFAHAGEIAMK